MKPLARKINYASTDDYLTAEEAAGFLEVKPTVIRNYLSEGKLTTYIFKTLTLLNKEELNHWKATHSRSGDKKG